MIYSCNGVHSENSTLKKVVKPADYLKNERQDNLEMIDLDDIENFSSLIDRMGTVTCKEKASALNFNYNDVEYNLMGYVGCLTTIYGASCYFRVNRIYVHNDSLYMKIGPDQTKVLIQNSGEYTDSLISKPYNY